jgi:hypothetical protein
MPLIIALWKSRYAIFRALRVSWEIFEAIALLISKSLIAEIKQALRERE